MAHVNLNPEPRNLDPESVTQDWRTVLSHILKVLGRRITEEQMVSPTPNPPALHPNPCTQNLQLNPNRETLYPKPQIWAYFLNSNTKPYTLNTAP